MIFGSDKSISLPLQLMVCLLEKIVCGISVILQLRAISKSARKVRKEDVFKKDVACPFTPPSPAGEEV